MTESVDEHERVIRKAFDAGDFQTAASSTLQVYSAEIFNFLAARLRSTSDAEEVISMFAEDLWKGLPSFGWRCSMRTWAYTLARHAASRYASSPPQRGRHNLPLSYPGVISKLVESIRHTTRAYQQTDTKDRFRALRDQLDDDDRTLLMLRVDRGMSWRDLAIALNGDPDLSDEALAREAARLRKAFERVRAEIKRLATRDGLLDTRD
jgi:RNA polymerase sigma-70 factor (ECF subfamily)